MNWKSLAATIGLVAATTAAGAADIKTISRGQRVVLSEHLVADKSVLFFFHATWCGACKQIGPTLTRLAADHEAQLALRKIDIVNWNSAAARQHRIQSIPHLVLYGSDGVEVAAGSPRAVLAKLGPTLKRRPAAATVAATAPPSTRPASGSAVPLLLLVAIIGGTVGTILWRRRAAAAATSGELWYVESSSGLRGPHTSKELRGLGLDATTPVCRKRDATRMSLADALRGDA